MILGQVIIALCSFGFYLINGADYFPHLLILSLINYAFALAIHRLPSQKKLLLPVILILDVAFLIGGKIQGLETKHFPLGISFFTFQIMSYIIDVSRLHTSPAQGLWHFQSYMFFFPHLIAGPICRANGLMKRMAVPFIAPSFDQIRSGLYLISFGLFKKAVLADTIALKVNEVFSTPSMAQGPFAWGIVIAAYGWQIYFDFSGYTDIARGLAKLVGLEIPLNFSFPYFARTLRDFWRRWHITLSEWFRDYVYIPLGGSKSETHHYVGAILVTFVLSAMWHGLGYNFLIWGIWHGLWLIIFKFSLKNIPSRLEQGMTIFVIFFGWVFFRAENIEQIVQILQLIMSHNAQMPSAFLIFKDLFLLTFVCLSIEIGAHKFRNIYRQIHPIVSDSVWIILTFCALVFQTPVKEFIYARF